MVSLGACSATWQRPAPDFVAVVRIASAAIVGIADDSGVIGSGFRARPSQLFVTAAHVVAADITALLDWTGLLERLDLTDSQTETVRQDGLRREPVENGHNRLPKFLVAGRDARLHEFVHASHQLAPRLW